MDEAAVSARVNEKFGARVLANYNFRGQWAVTVAPETLREVLTFLRDDPELAFDFLSDVGGVDYLTHPDAEERAWRFEVAYQMYSIQKNHRFRVKVAVRDESVEVPSVWDLWAIANWEEREVFDMFGIRFTGHPNLRRILNHDEFVGHPLRKDYPINKRQKLSQPSENLLTDRSELA
ncbi:MAG: NADH-quinone oxidoreductase subunit C [Myxococcota bacterium]